MFVAVRATTTYLRFIKLGLERLKEVVKAWGEQVSWRRATCELFIAWWYRFYSVRRYLWGILLFYEAILLLDASLNSHEAFIFSAWILPIIKVWVFTSVFLLVWRGEIVQKVFVSIFQQYLLDIYLWLEAVRVTEALLKGTRTLLKVTLHSPLLDIFKSLFPIIVIVSVFWDIFISLLLLDSILLLNVLNHRINFAEVCLGRPQYSALKHVAVIYDALVHIVLHLRIVVYVISLLLSHVLLKVCADLFQFLFELIRIELFGNIMSLIKCRGSQDNLFLNVWSMGARNITAAPIPLSDLTAWGSRIISILICQFASSSFCLINSVLQQMSILLQPLLVLA